MSISKKLFAGFLLTSLLIVVFSLFEYSSFLEIKRQVKHLEMTDSIIGLSLQLRRHEKNYFLRGFSQAQSERDMIHRYIEELNALLSAGKSRHDAPELQRLRPLIHEYERGFALLDGNVQKIAKEVDQIKSARTEYGRCLPLIETSFMEHPLELAKFLSAASIDGLGLVEKLNELSLQIERVRKTGEDMVNRAKELDKDARENVDSVIRISQGAIFALFFLFFFIGSLITFLISSSIAKRLGILTRLVEKTGSGVFDDKYVLAQRWRSDDEIGLLFEKFSDMSVQLMKREQELEWKNRELLQSKKLAAIGTLASGVAHELNNPLNNIFISAQVLMKEIGDGFPPQIQNIAKDMIGQTKRVKRIVADLLEFARGKETLTNPVDINMVIRHALRQVQNNRELKQIDVTLDTLPQEIILSLDPEQMERVFINLFDNAIDAMPPQGTLSISVEPSASSVAIRISDSGKGIKEEDLEKVFEPFFSTKDKGTGLGLSIVYNIIKKHKGDIKITSHLGRGTTFIITLPAGRDNHGT